MIQIFLYLCTSLYCVFSLARLDSNCTSIDSDTHWRKVECLNFYGCRRKLKLEQFTIIGGLFCTLTCLIKMEN